MLQRVKFSWTDDNHAEAVEMWRDGKSITEIAAFFQISRGTVAGHISRNRDVFAMRTMGRPATPKVKANGRVNAIWTDAKIDVAAHLWAAGVSAGEIADRFGVTKRAFFQICNRFRLRFPRRVKVQKKKPEPKIDLKALFDEVESSSPYDGSRFILSGQQPVAFASLKATQCKFPVSAPDEPCGPEMRCCGAERLTGRPYCAAHTQKARAA